MSSLTVEHASETQVELEPSDGVYVVNLATDQAGQCALCPDDDPPRAFYIVSTDTESDCVCSNHLEAAIRDR